MLAVFEIAISAEPSIFSLSFFAHLGSAELLDLFQKVQVARMMNRKGLVDPVQGPGRGGPRTELDQPPEMASNSTIPPATAPPGSRERRSGQER